MKPDKTPSPGSVSELQLAPSEAFPALPQTVHGLSNELYHHGEIESTYLSSTSLKNYAVSPKYARYQLTHPEPSTDAQRFGSLFHEAMERAAQVKDGFTPASVAALLDSRAAVFTPPLNPKTGSPYGPNTKAYAEAREAFTAGNTDRLPVTPADYDTLLGILSELLLSQSSTSRSVRQLLRWGTPEVSHFIEHQGCRFKYRPDLETRRKIVDWKTAITASLSERSVNGIITRYGYDISAAFYQFFDHERTGQWKEFYWCFITKTPPYDAILVNSEEWTYKINPDTGQAIPQAGAIKMHRLLDMHIHCEQTRQWPGAEAFIPADPQGRRIMFPTPPPWEISQIADLLTETLQ